MIRRIVLATVLCLAVAALGIGAAPALAAVGCTCHTEEPLAATAAHTPFVVGVDCTACHVAWTVPHPAAVQPRLALRAEAQIAEDSGQEGILLSGRLSQGPTPAEGVNGVLVYMQQRAAGADEFSDVAQMQTRFVLFGGGGLFGSTEAAMAEGMGYRAVSQGWNGGSLLEPQVSRTVEIKPALTLWKLSGLNSMGNLRLGRSVVAIWRAAPSWLAGEKVKLILRREGRRIVRVRMVERILRDDGLSARCRWETTPKMRGNYSMTAVWPATAKHPRITAGSWSFEVY